MDGTCCGFIPTLGNTTSCALSSGFNTALGPKIAQKQLMLYNLIESKKLLWNQLEKTSTPK